MRALLALALGVLTMSDVVADEPKKQEVPQEGPKLEAPYTEFVTVRHWDKQGKQFLKSPKFPQPAYRKDTKDGLALFVKGDFSINGTPTVDSEIIDKDGKVFVVTKVSPGSGESPFVCYVKPKPKP